MAIDPREIQLTEEQKRRLAEIADKSDKPWSEVLADAIHSLSGNPPMSSESNHQETPFERATRLGLVGCVKQGETDLSTNPLHMEGFGES